MQHRIIKILEFSLVVLLIAGAIWFVNRGGIDQIRTNVAQFGIWAPFMILLLRLTSIDRRISGGSVGDRHHHCLDATQRKSNG